MAEMTIKGAVQNTRNNRTDADGYALPPLAANLKEGQIAVNTCETDPCIFFKTSEGKIVKIVSEEKLTKALTDILGNSAADLDTLRELIALFEGSANDILPMLTALTDRVTAAETSLTNKADKSALNTHTGNTSNPHGVTYLQVGALAEDGTAINSDKLDNLYSSDFARYTYKPTGDCNKLFDTPSGLHQLDGVLTNTPIPTGNIRVLQIGTGARSTQMAFDWVSDRAFFRRKQDSLISSWSEFYHSGNSNNWASDWTAKNLKAINGHFKGTAPTNLIVEREGSDDNNSITFKAANLESYLGVTQGVLKFGTNLDLNTHGKVVYHSGNSNNAKADWTAKAISASELVHTKQRFEVRRGENGEKYSQFYKNAGNTTDYGTNIVDVTDGVSTIFVVSKDGLKLESGGKKTEVYHAGNSNKADVDWTCKQLKAMSGYSSYTADGLFDVKATPSSIQTPSLAKLIFGYCDNQAGLYAPRIGFETGDKKWSLGISGTDGGFHIGRGNTIGGSDVFIDSETGFIGLGKINATEKLDINGKLRVSGGVFIDVPSDGSNRDIIFGDTNITSGRQELLVIRASHRLNSNEFWSPRDKPFWFVNPIGAGTGEPTEQLDVNGNVRVRGSIKYTNDGPATLLRTNRSDGTLNNTLTTDGFNLILGTNNLTRLFIASGGNIGIGDFTQAKQPTEKLTVSGNGLFNGNVVAKGDVVAKSTNAVVFSTSDAAAGATRLNDLVDVKLPTTLSAKMVLAYDPAQVNSDGSKGGYTFMPSAGTGTGTVSSAEITSLPDHNHNDIGYVSASDERLKENIAPLTGALNILLHFKPKQYTWNAEGNRLGLNDPRAYGLIAQEAAELKDIVDIVRPMNTSEEYLGVDYVKIVPILIAGVQEQHKEIISLNQKLDSIKNRANKAYGSETNNADEIALLKKEIEELKMLIKK